MHDLRSPFGVEQEERIHANPPNLRLEEEREDAEVQVVGFLVCSHFLVNRLTPTTDIDKLTALANVVLLGRHKLRFLTSVAARAASRDENDDFRRGKCFKLTARPCATSAEIGRRTRVDRLTS